LWFDLVNGRRLGVVWASRKQRASGAVAVSIQRVTHHVERDYDMVKVAGDVDSHGEVCSLCGLCGRDGGESGLAGEVGFGSRNGVICLDCLLSVA
jgi:hypothetical protein